MSRSRGPSADRCPPRGKDPTFAPRRRVRRTGRGIRLAAALLAVVLLLGPASATRAHELVPGQLGSIGFDQHPGAQVPPDATFRDENGKTVVLGDYLGSRPVILTMNYLDCPNLCPLILEGLASGMSGLPFTLGDQFTVVTVSIDPRDGPALARTLKLRAMRAYAHPEASAGWHILTGTHEQIDRVADAVGFRYAYDADQDDYAHPAGAIVLTPGGQVSRYLYGIDFSSTDLRLALVEAGQQRIGSLVDRALLVCYHYVAETGRYTPVILDTLRWIGAAMVLGLGTFIGLLWRADLRRGRGQPGSGA